MHLVDLYRLESIGGRVWQRYCELLAAGDASAYGSPAANALAEFQRDWANDPAAVIAAIEAEAAEVKTEV